MNITRCVSSFFLRLLLLLVIIKKIILLLLNSYYLFFHLNIFSQITHSGLIPRFLTIVFHSHSQKYKVENILNRIFWWTLYSNLIWRINKNIQTSSSSCFWILPFYLWSSWVGFILRLVLLSYYSTNGNNNREAGEGRPFKNVEEIAMALENCKLFPKTSHLDLLVPTPSWYGKGMTKEGKGSFFSFKIFQIDWIFAGFPLDVCIYAVLVIVATLSHSLSLISCVLALQWRHTFPASLWQRWIRFEFCIRVQHNENISGLWCGLFTLCGREFEWKEY